MRSITIRLLAALAVVLFAVSCADDDEFTTSSAVRLTFSVDTVKMDTVFSTMPSSTRSFWVYNKQKDGIRCTAVRLEGGNQTGFRVNVDGAYLGASAGYRVNDIEVRGKDSIRVFVELTSPLNNQSSPVEINDELVFTLESGVEQRVKLNAFTWDALQIGNWTVESDTTLTSVKPVVVNGGIEVAEGATLTIASGTTLYFNSSAGMDVRGRLLCLGEQGAKVVMRTNRLDNMFDYLPYNYVSGMWQGLHFYETSYENRLQYTDIHGSFDGIQIDSASVERQKLTIENTTIHNCQGAALTTTNARLSISNSELSNTLGNCLSVNGGIVEMNNCTLAQFYPFDSGRGAALSFSAETHPLLSFICRNTLITGYADDEMYGSHDDSGTNDFNFDFYNCIIRTPRVETDDSLRFHNVIFEEYSDTVKTGKKHFAKIDTDNLRYDFRLDSISPAIDAADVETATATDHDGLPRDDRPDIGAYEYQGTKPSSIKPKTKRQ